MRIGCVVPVYNRRVLVLEALDSIASQSRLPDEVVVVDDASTDDTADCVAGWLKEQARGPAWRLLRLSENGGQSRARNLAIAEIADCDVIAFLDSDDLWPTDYLERVAKVCAERPDAVAAVADHARERPSRAVLAVVRDQRWVAKSTLWGLVRNGALTPSSVAVRRSALIRAGGFDESLRYAEDLKCYLQLAALGPLVHNPGPPIRYRVDASAQLGEARAVSQSESQVDQAFQLARIVGDFCQSSRPDNARAVAALGWFRAGAAAFHVGDWAACRTACARTLQHQPWHGRAMWRWTCATAASALGLGRNRTGTNPRSPGSGASERSASDTADRETSGAPRCGAE